MYIHYNEIYYKPDYRYFHFFNLMNADGEILSTNGIIILSSSFAFL